MSATPEELSPQIQLSIESEEEKLSIQIEPDVLYGSMRSFLSSLLINRDSDTPEQKRMIQLVRTGIRGILLMSGETLLSSLFGSKNHPKPGKGDDLVDWYADMLTKIAIAAATKSMLVMHTERINAHEPIIVTELHSLSVTTATNTRLGIRQESEGTQASQSAPCDACS